MRALFILLPLCSMMWTSNTLSSELGQCSFKDLRILVSLSDEKTGTQFQVLSSRSNVEHTSLNGSEFKLTLIDTKGGQEELPVHSGVIVEAGSRGMTGVLFSKPAKFKITEYAGLVVIYKGEKKEIEFKKQ